MEYQLSNLPRYIPITPRSQVANSPVAKGHILLFSEDGESLTVKKSDGSYVVVSDSSVSATGQMPWRTNDNVIKYYVKPGGKLYDAASDRLIDGNGVWSFAYNEFGVRDYKLYRIVDESAQLLDATPAWSHVSNGCAIRNGQLYFIDSGGNVSVADNTGVWTDLVPTYLDDAPSMGIRDGKLVLVSRSDTGITVTPCLTYNDWTMLCSGFGIRNGRLYSFRKLADGSVLVKQVEFFTDWMACSGYAYSTTSDNVASISVGLGIRNGIPYLIFDYATKEIRLNNEKAVACSGNVWTDTTANSYNSGFILTANGNVYEVKAHVDTTSSGYKNINHYVSKSPVNTDCTAILGSFRMQGIGSTTGTGSSGFCLKNGKVEHLNGIQWDASKFSRI